MYKMKMIIILTDAHVFNILETNNIGDKGTACKETQFRKILKEMKVKIVSPIIECGYCFDFLRCNEITSKRLKDCLLHNNIKEFQEKAYFKDKGIIKKIIIIMQLYKFIFIFIIA